MCVSVRVRAANSLSGLRLPLPAPVCLRVHAPVQSLRCSSFCLRPCVCPPVYAHVCGFAPLACMCACARAHMSVMNAILTHPAHTTPTLCLWAHVSPEEAVAKAFGHIGTLRRRGRACAASS